MQDDGRVLVPYTPEEAIKTGEAASIAKVTPRAIREWAVIYPIARRIGGEPPRGRLYFSRVALQMLMESDWQALDMYASGDRDSREVLAYFGRLGIPAPQSVQVFPFCPALPPQVRGAN